MNIDGFQPLGYMSEDGIARPVSADGDAPVLVGLDGGQWVAQCDGCPASYNDDYGYWQKAEWQFEGDGAKRRAEAFAKRHNSLQGHKVNVLSATTFTFQLHPSPLQWVGDWEALLRMGDAGDLGSVGKL